MMASGGGHTAAAVQLAGSSASHPQCSVDTGDTAFMLFATAFVMLQVRGVTFSFLCPLFEKYGTFIERCNALIEKVSTCIRPQRPGWPRRAW
eukprot:SAG31_NODE_9063_length_1341_cov_1.722222_1_plen_92_part_00